jgi:hypothetical protein
MALLINIEYHDLESISFPGGNKTVNKVRIDSFDRREGLCVN